MFYARTFSFLATSLITGLFDHWHPPREKNKISVYGYIYYNIYIRSTKANSHNTCTDILFVKLLICWKLKSETRYVV